LATAAGCYGNSICIHSSKSSLLGKQPSGLEANQPSTAGACVLAVAVDFIMKCWGCLNAQHSGST
jgi:hypothetical protein